MRRALFAGMVLFSMPAAASVMTPGNNWQQKGTILTGPQALDLLRPCSRIGPVNVQRQWTPTSQDIQRLESALRAFHAQLMKRVTDPRFNLSLDAYHRQYAGFVSGGRSVIYLNLWRTAAPPTWWRDQAALVCDGGPTNWGVEWEVSTGRFLNPAFNGR